MRSRGKARVGAEWGLRLVAVALLTWALWRALQPAGPPAVGRVDATVLRPALERWTTAPAPRAVHVTLDSGAVPPAYARQWLVALRARGTTVTWSAAAPLLASAIDAEPVADPRGGTRVRVAAPGGARVIVRDALGPLDSIRVAPGGLGITMTIPALLRGVDGVVAGTPARGVVVDSLTLRHLLVLGRAGWESKFLVRSLEEEGWMVDLRLAVAPTADVVQGHVGAIDTARYAAVLAVDSSVAPAATRIATYVRSGGGLVLMGSAAHTSALLPATAPTSDAVVLERRGGAGAVAARRVGMGRVIQVQSDDTWRWRMAGGDSGAARHRAWWAGVVASVAYAPRTERPLPADADAAPLAHLIDALGPPVATAASAPPGRIPLDPTRSPWVFGAVLATLVLEWASRRLRGRR
jgi:hypothetical protein